MKRGMTLRRGARAAGGVDAFDGGAALLLASLIVIVAISYGDYGISNDEIVQQHYGELIIRYYSSGFSDRTLFGYDNLYLYGGLFDVAATLLAQRLPLDLYAVRHLLCAAVGIGGVVATWATARMIAGPRAGLIAAVALCVCGAWYGGMFNHTKDVTFAAAMMGATGMILRLVRALPRPPLHEVLLAGLVIGAALGLRALGLLLLVYGACAVLLEWAGRDFASRRDRFAFLGRSLLTLAPALVVAYAIMIAAWPWAALEIFNPIRGLLTFTHFRYPIRTILAGQTYDMAEVPRWYVPAYLLIRLPLMTLVGFLFALLFTLAPRLGRPTMSPRARRETALVAVTVFLPVAAHVIAHGPAFSGIRHFLFVVPPLAVLAGIGFDVLMRRVGFHRPVLAATVGMAVVAAAATNALTLLRLHPHQYLAYNSLVGGLEGAAGRYASDYWVNIMPEAVRLLDLRLTTATTGSAEMATPFYVAVCAERLQFEKVASPRLVWTDDWERADFFISPTHMNCDRLLAGEVIVAIRRLDTLVGVVKDRRAITRGKAALSGTTADGPEAR